MKITAKNHKFAHLVEQERETQYVVVKASTEIEFQSDTATIVIPLKTSSLQQVCEYYQCLNYRVTIVVDSQNYRKKTVRILKDNYLGLRCSVFDLSIGESLPNPKSENLQHLCTGFKLTRSGNLAQLAATVAIRKIPFTFSCADECAAVHIKDESLQAPFIRCLNRRIKSVKQAVEDDLEITLSDNHQKVDNLKDIELSQLASTTAIQAATGVGETSHVYAPTAMESSPDGQVVYISHLIALVEQFCLKTGSASYKEKDLRKFTQANSMGSVINSVSKPHILEKICSSSTLLIDEYEKVYKTIVCSDNSKTMQADRVFEALVYILKTVPRVIVADADLTDNSLAFLKRVRGDLSVIECTANPYNAFTANVLSKKELLDIEKIRTVLKRDKVCLFDNLKTLKRTVAQLGYQNQQGLDCEMKALEDGVLVLHSDNRDMDAQEAFLSDPNREIQKYKAIMASPCLGAGFSIVENYTSTVNVVCESTLIPRELVNFSRRFRCAEEYNFWCDDGQNTYNVTQYGSHSDLGQRYDESLKFIKQKQKLNEHLALSLYFTLEKLGFKVSCNTAIRQKGSVANNKRFDVEFKAKQQVAVVNAVDISSEDFVLKQRSNRLSSVDIAETRKFEIKAIYKLDKVCIEHVRFDDNFDRELFAHFPFVLDKAALVKNRIYSRQKEYIANSLYLYLFKRYGFEEDKSKCFLHKSSVFEVLAGMDSAVLDHYFPPYLKQPKTQENGQTNKATGYIKSVLSRCGFVLGRYGGSEQKARVSMSPLAQQYQRWLKDN
ncbi:hypothetical protein AB6D70_19800 [Vibrio splendidus]